MGGVTAPEYWLSDVFPAHVSDPEEELDVKLGGGSWRSSCQPLPLHLNRSCFGPPGPPVSNGLQIAPRGIVAAITRRGARQAWHLLAGGSFRGCRDCAI